jgi:hypothetical protein
MVDLVFAAAADNVGVVDGRNKYIFGRHGPRLAKFCPHFTAVWQLWREVRWSRAESRFARIMRHSASARRAMAYWKIGIRRVLHPSEPFW